MPIKTKKHYYTVFLEYPGFPVLYLCPGCGEISGFLPHSFEDPGEASQEFLAAWSAISNFEWEYEELSLFLIRAFEEGFKNGC